MKKPNKVRIPYAWPQMRPGDLNPQRVSAERLAAMLEAAKEQGLWFELAPEFDHDTARYVRRLPDETGERDE